MNVTSGGAERHHVVQEIAATIIRNMIQAARAVTSAGERSVTVSEEHVVKQLLMVPPERSKR